MRSRSVSQASQNQSLDYTIDDRLNHDLDDSLDQKIRLSKSYSFDLMHEEERPAAFEENLMFLLGKDSEMETTELKNQTPEVPELSVPPSPPTPVAEAPLQVQQQAVLLHSTRLTKTCQKTFTSKMIDHLRTMPEKTDSYKNICYLMNSLMEPEFWQNHDPFTVTRCLRSTIRPLITGGTLTELKRFNGKKGKFFRLNPSLPELQLQVSQLQNQLQYYQLRCQELEHQNYCLMRSNN